MSHCHYNMAVSARTLKRMVVFLFLGVCFVCFDITNVLEEYQKYPRSWDNVHPDFKDKFVGSEHHLASGNVFY